LGPVRGRLSVRFVRPGWFVPYFTIKPRLISIEIETSVAQLYNLTMNFEREKRDQQSLALFLGSSLRITDKSQLEEFLAQADARKLVYSAPYQDVFLIIKMVGLADSLELLRLTSKEQRRGFVDLDCWRKDSFHMPSFMEWLAAFIQCGPEETVRMARAVDPNLLALFLRENIQVHSLDPDEPSPDLPLTLTPDNRFGIEITGEAEAAMISRLLLDALFRFDPALGYDLIDRVYWENRVSLEEGAYQEKRRRLEEIGFVDYYDALEIYGEAHLTLTPLPSKDDEKKGTVALSSTLPALFVASLVPGDFLWEALQTVQDRKEAERISQGLAALANRLLSIHSVTPGDLEKVRPALEELRDTLSLGLEYLAQGQKDQVGEILQRNDIQSLFKIGFNLLSILHDQADRIFRQGRLRLDGVEETLLESPEAEFFSGLRRLRPLFFEGLEDPGKATYRSFGSLIDIEISKKILKEIGALGHVFWKVFGDSVSELSVESLGSANVSLRDLRFSQIFNTAVVNSLSKGMFQPVILSGSDLQEFLKSISARKPNRIQFAEQLISLARMHIEESVEDLQEGSVLLRFLEKWSNACAEELVPLMGEAKIDPRLIRTLIVRAR